MKQVRLLAVLGAFFAIASIAQAQEPDFSCSSTKPCKIGCCGKTGVCGLGPKFCGADVCQSSCDAKSECDPGWGGEWSDRGKCPLNVCCSKFGFCGTTKDFCGDETVKSPSCSGTSASKRIIGYYEGWSSTRACGGMFPEDLPVNQYTHLNYAFAFIDPKSFEVAPMADNDKELYPRFTALKQQNPGLETWISIGGWSMNDADQPTAKTFSQLAASESAQSKFFTSLVKFMSNYGFDGVDVDWEYPVASERSGTEVDFVNFVSFLKNLRDALGSGGHKYGLTLTIPSSYWYMQHFDIKKIEKIVDWINVMTYDLHGTWDSTSPFLGPIVNSHTNLTEIDMTMDLLWRNDIDPKKVVMGIGFYGRSFTLSDPSCKKAGCTFSGGGNPGSCTASAGTLSYGEIGSIVEAGATVTEDSDAAVAIVTWDQNQWVSYDNKQTLKKKMDYANKKCLGGVMVWAASTDDPFGTAISALTGVGGGQNLAQASLFGSPKQPLGQCVWGECGQDCPSGFTPATGSGGKRSGYAGIFNGCENDESRYYCCPTGTEPKCEWKGTAPFCGATSGGRCSDKQVEVTTDSRGTGQPCWTGHKTLCCEHTKGTSDIDQCKWFGAAPYCTTLGAFNFPPTYFTSADCKDEYKEKLTTSKQGAGGEKPCTYNSGFKSYCCKDPVPFKNCAWHQGRDSWTAWSNSYMFSGILGSIAEPFAAPALGQDCKGECPSGQVPIATDGLNCQAGTYSYFCCDNPNNPTLPAPADALCPSPSGGVARNFGPGPDGPASNIFAESTYTDGECGPVSSRFLKRTRDTDWATPHMVEVADDANYTLFLDGRGLEKRAVRDTKNALSLCLPGRSSSDIYPQTYSGYKTIAGLTNKGWIHVAKPLVCGVLGVIIDKTQPANVEFVTEHVFEKKSLKNAIESMALGTLPNGATLPQGPATVDGIFDPNGVFFQDWPAGFTQPFGATPVDTAFGELGHSAPNLNVANLQIVDADLNGIKTLITAQRNFATKLNFGSLPPKQMVAYLSDVIDTFNYMKLPQTIDSYNAAYRGLVSFWNEFAKIPGVQQGYDYSAAFKGIMKADIGAEVSVAQGFFKTAVAEAAKIWETASKTENFSPSEVKENLATLEDLASNVAKYISLDANAMTK